MPPVQSAEPGGPLCCGLFTLSAEIRNTNKPTPAISFLIDTGSCLSILPRSFATTNISSGCLRAANGSGIPTYGTISLTFTLPNISDVFTWSFTVADTLQPILGADFFERFNYLVDCKKHTLVASDDFSVPRQRMFAAQPNLSCITIFPTVNNLNSDDCATNLKCQIPFLFPNCITKSLTLVPENLVTHSIPTSPCQPYRTKRRELPLNKRQAVEEEFRILESSGVIRRSSSPWASAIHVVTKSDGTFRPCGDYRFLNSITVHDSYPMPLIADIISKLHGKTVFSKIDLHKAFHQIPVAPEDIIKTAVITPFGLFEYLMMPFGLRNAAQSFQRHIDTILRDCSFARPYLDDILIFSPDNASHLVHIHDVLKKLNDSNMVINMKKCEFFSTEVQFLGHFVSANGIRPIPSKLEAISEIKLPKTVTNLRSFLGAVNFYHKFIPGASSLLSPLSLLTTGPKSSVIKWSDTSIAAFESVKSRLMNLVALKFYNPDAKLQLTTDASDHAMGAVLHQITNGTPEPIEFFSRKLNSAQINYSAFDRELLAIHEAVKHFRNILEGRQFLILTDHKPLIHLSTLKNPSPRQLRQVTFLSEFDFEISHLSGKNNVVADFFSRPDVSAISRLSLFSETPLNTYSLDAKDLAYFGNYAKLIDNAYYDISIPGCVRPIVPVDLRRKAFESVHNLHHPGSHNTYDLMHTRFIWPYMRKDVRTWCQECTPCQKNKITRHTKPPILSFPTGNRFETLHLDIVGPLPMSHGKTYILTMIDRKTRWPEAVPIGSITAENIAKHLVDTWFSRYGIPDNIITDQGTQFEGSLFKVLSDAFGFKHIHTTAYHPQANGMIERFHRSLKTSLRCLSISANWSLSLPLVLLGWRNTMHSATGTSPAKLLFGVGTTFPSEFLTHTVDIPFEALDLARRHFLDSDTNPSFGPIPSHKSYLPKSLTTCQFVWLQARDTFHMKPRYVGPYRIVEFRDNNTITILKDNKPYTVNLEKVKPAFGFDDTLKIHQPLPIPSENNDLSPVQSDIPVTGPTTVPSSEVSTQFCNTSHDSTSDISNKKPIRNVSFSKWSVVHFPNSSSDLPKRLTRTKN